MNGVSQTKDGTVFKTITLQL